ncbi:unnamed protein product [Adineta ricciae]|uniref:Wax synthase domain-containing protein n=1 Tax=Adineta ricciae TaxID=249248 RepID=A0A815MNM9_ADIRI|nr:unnamed protein product [Adineta ricciae]
MQSLILINSGWLLHFVLSFYLIRHINHLLLRGVLTLIPCIILTDIGARNLPPHDIQSVFGIACYWMMCLRLLHLVVLSVDQSQTFLSFLCKCLWIYFPVKPCSVEEKQWSVMFHLLSAVIKFLLNRLIHKWLLICEANDSYIRVMVYFISILTFSYVIDLETVLVRIITRDQYTMQSLNNIPFLSQSVREFWGQRYNQIIGTILKESLFQPLNLYISSRSISSLLTFTVSGLFHAHIVLVVFNDKSSLWSTFAGFFLNGIACGMETYLPARLPSLFRYMLTYGVLLFTAPMCLGPYAEDKAVYFGVDPLSSLGDRMISILPVPNICPV